MDAMVLEQSPAISMPNLKEKKKKVMNEIKSKLEAAKLNLIYTELDELGIKYERNYSTVKELEKDLKTKLNDLDFNKVNRVIHNVDEKLEALAAELEAGSTNALTKLMTSDLAKTIGKTLGISLAGRTALILAPTIGTKALVGAGLAGYGLYRILKNRQEIIKINESNELNNILSELEAKKENDKYIDTRFDEATQAKIREYLKGLGVVFDDTGYRSLRATIYSLDTDNKRGLCEYLNLNLGRGINIEERVTKAKKKLNVVASNVATVATGATLGINLASAINTVDPGLAAGVLNGTVIGVWVESIVNKPWFSALSGGLGLIGTEVLERLPYVGDFFNSVFAAENLATFATIGAAGGLVVGLGMGLVSVGKQIKDRIKNDKENKKFLTLDQSKYAEEDKEELKLMAEKLKEPANLLEVCIIDLVIGYLKEENIVVQGNPKTIAELKAAFEKLNDEEKKKAYERLNKINNNIDNNPQFVQDVKKAGKIAIGLFTAGLAALSVFDIAKGGTFLPELSQTLFPSNNIHAPVPIPDPIDQPIDPNSPEWAEVQGTSQSQLNDFMQNERYLTEKDGDYFNDYASAFGTENPGFAGSSAQMYIQDVGASTNFIDNVLDWFGIHISYEKVPDIGAISEQINTLKGEKLYNFYRFINNIQTTDNPEMLNAIKFVLGFNNNLEEVSNYINGYVKTQNLNNMINSISEKLATGAIPFAAALETLGIVQKQKSDEKFGVDEQEVKSIGK